MGKQKTVRLVPKVSSKASDGPPLAADAAERAPDFLVVGIGASAGGLEAFTRILAPIPASARLAVVLVQHLSRNHPSLLKELLGAKTALSVVEGADGHEIRPGFVYVIRPDTHLTVRDGHLRVSQRPIDRGTDSPVDRLFESLAEQYGERAIGVVLSGSGHDGAAGARQIKGAGGIVLVQDPEEAESNGMPRAALGMGDVADLVLPAEALAAELLRLSEHPFFMRGPPVQERGVEDPADAELLPVFQLLRRSMGVDFTHYKPLTVQRRIRRRMALHRVHDFPSYVRLLKEHSSEVELLHDDILIHVTSFFREPESFAALRESVFPELFKAHQDETPLRVWVPGCSSGEEAYSIAIALLEALREHSEIPLQVFGTDVSHRMIVRARDGTYPPSAMSDVGPERQRQFFVSYGEGFRVNPTVRERCVFARQDVTRDPPFSKLDLVLCRNLLIYLGQPLQRRAIEVFHYALNPHGFLVLGRSETVGAQTELFEAMDGRWKIYRRRPGPDVSRRMAFAVRPPEQPSTLPAVAARGPRGESDIQAEANRLLIERYAPASIIIDDASRIVRATGRTARYLELPSGDVSLDALKMVRRGLLSPLKSALEEARRLGGTVRREGIRVTSEGVSHAVNLEVTPLGNAGNRHFLVQFEAPSVEKKSTPRQTNKKPKSKAASASVLEQLQLELNSTRQDLQSMIQDLEAANEELQSANEEILSSNEELQSTNEELDTAREELQSTNEELSTVNDELQGRNTQLTEVNSDLVNLLGSVQIPIVMVSGDLKIRRFTPAAERVLNLIPSDVGRPIGHIKPNIRCPDLEAIIRRVIDTVTVHEREVSDGEGNTFVLRVRPYKSIDNRIDGAVLALFDLSTPLKLARETGEAVMSRLADPALLIDGKLVVQWANPAFFAAFGGSAVEVDGQRLFALNGGAWNVPRLRALLEEQLPTQKMVEGYAVTIDFAPGAPKDLVFDAKYVEHDGVGMILLLIKAAIPCP